MESIYSVENFESKGAANEINSPRSLDACLQLGYDPNELLPKTKKECKELWLKSEPHLTDEMIDLKYKHFEAKRKSKVEAVKAERVSIIGSLKDTRHLTLGGSVNSPVEQKTSAKSAALLLEEKRMEALRKRQQDELAKIVEREQVMADLQAKIKKAEDEEFKRLQLHEKKVAQQRQAEMKKAEARKAEEKRLLEEEAAKKRELEKQEAIFEAKMAKLRKAEEKRLEQEALQREKERKEKLEESRKKTEALIQAQFDKAEENRKIMLERELRVKAQLEEKKKAKAAEVQAAREKADKRIKDALDASQKIQEKKKEDYNDRTKRANERTAELKRKQEEAAKKEAEEREKAERIRIQRLVDSYKQRSQHRQEIIDHSNSKNQGFLKVKAEREYKLSMMKFNADLKIQDKLENVDRQARVNEFQRLTWLKKIEDDDRKFEEIQDAKRKLELQHEMETKNSIIRKHEIADTMEKMRQTNDFTLLDKLFAKKAAKKVDKKEDEDDPAAPVAAS
jgi:hypothetical protein